MTFTRFAVYNCRVRARLISTDSPTLEPLPSRWHDIAGRTFGRLTVLGYAGKKTKHGQKMATCRCDCGNFVDVMPSSLRRGATSSCGCVQSEAVARRNRQTATHGAARGAGNKPLPYLYRAWVQIKSRCHHPKNPSYVHYGGRGIKLYDPWHDYATFEAGVHTEMGPRPSRAYSIDRIDNDAGYMPGNIRWATSAQQSRNRRSTKLYRLAGEEKPLAEWADLAGVRYDTVKSRIVTYGWPLDDALGTPAGVGRCPLDQRRKWTESAAYRKYREKR